MTAGVLAVTTNPDPFEEARLAQVHPPDWRNPAPARRYDLVVVGGGTAGLVTAVGAAGLGARVALVEKHRLGGDCLNVGCVPSKLLLRAARAARSVDEARAFGVAADESRVDFAAVMERLRRVRSELAPTDGAPRLASLGIDVFFGEARFANAREVEVDGARLRFKRACLAVGTRPFVPPIPGLAEAGYLTNETIFERRERPRRLAVIGGGPIGAELAQAFRALGSEVTILETGPRLLARDDPEASELVAARFRREGIELRLGVKIVRVDRSESEGRIELADGGRASCDALLVATGRRVSLERLGLEEAGVDFDAKGVRVDDRLRTTNKRIYAAGDVASPFRFTHAADAMARIVLQNALFFGRKRASALVIPWTTYTHPEVAGVGLTATQAAEKGFDVGTFRVGFDEVDRAVVDGDEGFVKVHVRRGTDRIVGATIVGAHAGDLLSPVVLAMSSGLGLRHLASTVLPYPTEALALKRAGDNYQRTRLTKRAAALLRLIVRMRR